MKAIHRRIRKSILKFVDFFYPLFRRIMPLTTFRYAACGGFNTVFSILLYYIGNKIIFKGHNVNLGFMVMDGAVAPDYLFAIWIAFPVGFYLSRYVVFQESTLHRRVQLFRYFVVIVGNMTLNYIFLKIFTRIFAPYNTVGKIATAIVVIVYSYFAQRHFSFKTHKGTKDVV
ncbi:MAG TPA: GtrA family protein [Chitinophagaceae bacterium]|nr:GtrA family protein [Chitinophagaceae bacterium]